MSLRLKILTVVLIFGAPLQASSKKNAPGSYLNMFFGPFVHKSDSVGGTDFSNILGINAGVNYGKNKQIGFHFHNDRMSTNFRQSGASIESDFNEFAMSYRILWFLPTLVLGHGTMKANSDDPAVGEIFDTVFTQLGYGFDLEMPYTSMITTYVRIRSIATPKVHDAQGKSVRFTPRNELNVGVNVVLPIPIVQFNAGYMHRSLSIEVDDGGLKPQVQTGPYVGLNFAHDF